LLYRISRLLVATLLLLFTRRRVRGRDNIPKQGPLIVVANHLSSIDPPLVDSVLGRRAVFMAKEELFRSRITGYIMVNLGAFPVNKGRPDRGVLRRAMQVLADGQALVIFPEGMRSKSGRLGLAFPGAALIFLHSGAPIVPIGISGTERIKGFFWLWHRPKITVAIGKTFTLPPISGKLTKDGLSRLTDVIMMHIAELLPPEYRGGYAGKEIKWR
jgi:1-acyl-sn-glycerol-3-phosphate acyltransferase